MENKEIIMVDDVDVSECEFYGYCCGMYVDNYGDTYLKCTDFDCNNCYYKQLKRTEQQLESKDKEIEKLKEKLEVATEALNFITGTCPDNECKKHKYIITRKYQDCYHCLVEKAQQALKQIESEER